MNVNTLRSFIASGDDFTTVTGVPLENSRVFADSDDIERYFTRLDEVISVGSIPAAFILNVDESGFNSFVTARKSIRIVPAIYAQISIPVPKRERR